VDNPVKPFDSRGVGANQDDCAAYYAQREQAERTLAESAASAKARDVHLKLAAKYAELAERESGTATPIASRELRRVVGLLNHRTIAVGFRNCHPRNWHAALARVR
jgi:hypothetical protein